MGFTIDDLIYTYAVVGQSAIRQDNLGYHPMITVNVPDLALHELAERKIRRKVFRPGSERLTVFRAVDLPTDPITEAVKSATWAPP